METQVRQPYMVPWLWFLSYLWGMETNLNDLKAYSVIIDSSYPTYEEWKPSFLSFSIFTTPSSYPTYEEWKLLILIFLAVSSYPSSYPTYEEWKPARILKPARSISVLILPMRNGNNISFLPTDLPLNVLILPMRNGNLSPIWNHFLDYSTVLILPMRNGNSV